MIRKKLVGTELSETKRISALLLYLHKKIENQIQKTRSTIPQPNKVEGDKGFQVMEMSMCLKQILEEEISQSNSTLELQEEEQEKVTGKRLIKNVIGSQKYLDI